MILREGKRVVIKVEDVLAVRKLTSDIDERALATANIFGYLWAKEAYGAMLFANHLKPFCDLAFAIVGDERGMPEGTPTQFPLPRNPERTVALRKLLEAKDCIVRSRLG